MATINCKRCGVGLKAWEGHPGKCHDAVACGIRERWAILLGGVEQAMAAERERLRAEYREQARRNRPLVQRSPVTA